MILSKRVKGCIGILILFLVWSFVSYKKIYSEYLLPSPIDVWKDFIIVVQNGSLIENVLISLKRILAGYLIAFILAFGLGISTIYFKSLAEYLDYIIQFLRNVAPLSLIPLLILWFGIGESSKILIIILASFFPMFLNIENGFKNVDIKLLEVGKVFNYTRFETFKNIILPSSLPSILVGMRTGLGYAYRAIIGAEMIAASSGIGYMINFARSMSNTKTVLVGIFVIGILGCICDSLFKIFVNKYLKDRIINE